MTYGYHVGWITTTHAGHVFLIAPAAETWDAGPPCYCLPLDDDAPSGIDGLEFV